jgi:hypothetical protein
MFLKNHGGSENLDACREEAFHDNDAVGNEGF